MAYQQPHFYADGSNLHVPQHQPADQGYYASTDSVYDVYGHQGDARYQQQDDPYTAGGYADSAYSHDQRSVHTTDSRMPLNHSPYAVSPSYPPMPSPSPQYAYSPSIEKSAHSYNGYFPQPANAYNHVTEKIMRKRSKKQVPLQNGNLVLDCPTPSSILTHAKAYPGAGPKEFETMRYTAVTCDPDDFNLSKYTLRPYLYGRETALAVCMTMYNEDETLFHRTWSSAVKNLSELHSRTRSKTWGPDSWKKVVVVIVSDGRKKVHAKTLKMLQLMGVYQEGVMKDSVAGKDTQAHIFEYTTQVTVDDTGNVNGGIMPIQICFILKEANKKKLNSHRWFMNAFCHQINPNVVILLDVGTKPTSDSYYLLYKEFEKHANVGGACGEICVDTGRACGNLLRPLVAAQNFEYVVAGQLDKPLESFFGYIAVLPGAFSAYRWKALRNGPDGKGPLQKYFLGEKMHEVGATAGTFEANMFLAEDRILCFEIVSSPRGAWVLRYVKAAKASTDVPTTIDEFIGQRRRWLNGSLFALIYAVVHFYRIWGSGHNFFRKVWLQLEFLYQTLQVLFTLTALANFFLALFFVCNAATSVPANDPFGGQGPRVVSIVLNGWIAAMIVVLVCSLGNRPRGSRFAYTGVLIYFAISFCIGLYCSAWVIFLVLKSINFNRPIMDVLKSIVSQKQFRDIVISLAATYVMYFVAALLYLNPWHMITSFLQYMLYLPFFINVLGVYSIANTHDLRFALSFDCNWGTKTDGAPAKDLGGAHKKTGTDGKEAVEVTVPTAAEDINSLWLAARKDLSVKTVEVKSKRGIEDRMKDRYANFRTRFLLFYIGLNTAMVIVFTSAWWNDIARKEGAVSSNPYMTFIFWSVAGMSAFRAFGSVMYLIGRIFA